MFFSSMETQEKVIKGNLLLVSNKKDIKSFLSIARQMLNDHKEIEITAIGESISNAIIIGETLCRNKFTQWAKIETFTINSKRVEEKQEKNEQEKSRNYKKIKISIKLNKL